MFNNKTIIITGASSGLGRQLAIQLASLGANLVLMARRLPALQETAQACCLTQAAQCIEVVGDVTRPEDCKLLIDTALAEFGRIDYLINNAGVGMWSPFVDITHLDIFEKLIATNYLGTVYCTYYALPFIKQQKGMIVAISSLQGKIGIPWKTGYTAAKHAVQGFFDSLRLEIDPRQGMEILVVSPGWIQDTQLGENTLLANTSPSLEETRKQYRHQSRKSALPLDYCVKEIIHAMRKRKKELLLPKKARLLIWVHALFPRIANYYIRRKVN